MEFWETTGKLEFQFNVMEFQIEELDSDDELDEDNEPEVDMDPLLADY